MTSDERRRLLKIARDAIVAHVHGTPVSETFIDDPDGVKGGAFVTLHRGDELRGCIGHIERDEFLVRVVARCAVAASTSDPRFRSVTAGELDDLSIELSILGPLEPIAGADDIEVGRHGLLIEKGWSRGLLLPQVATEWRWDREQFLEQTCRKAGLPPTAWKSGANLWRFDAEVFGEER
jgi:AmmeMemoRadiSam system protein A